MATNGATLLEKSWPISRKVSRKSWVNHGSRALLPDLPLCNILRIGACNMGCGSPAPDHPSSKSGNCSYFNQRCGKPTLSPIWFPSGLSTSKRLKGGWHSKILFLQHTTGFPGAWCFLGHFGSLDPAVNSIRELWWETVISREYLFSSQNVARKWWLRNGEVYCLLFGSSIGTDARYSIALSIVLASVFWSKCRELWAPKTLHNIRDLLILFFF